MYMFKALLFVGRYVHDCFYTPTQQSCKGGILESACPAGQPSFIFCMEVSHEYQMTLIDFEVTGLKVKVTGALT